MQNSNSNTNGNSANAGTSNPSFEDIIHANKLILTAPNLRWDYLKLFYPGDGTQRQDNSRFTAADVKRILNWMGQNLSQRSLVRPFNTWGDLRRWRDWPSNSPYWSKLKPSVLTMINEMRAQGIEFDVVFSDDFQSRAHMRQHLDDIDAGHLAGEIQHVGGLTKRIQTGPRGGKFRLVAGRKLYQHKRTTANNKKFD